jgi:hypothetical protein
MAQWLLAIGSNWIQKVIFCKKLWLMCHYLVLCVITDLHYFRKSKGCSLHLKCAKSIKKVASLNLVQFENPVFTGFS